MFCEAVSIAELLQLGPSMFIIIEKFVAKFHGCLPESGRVRILG